MIVPSKARRATSCRPAAARPSRLYATDRSLLNALSAGVASGSFLTTTTERYPTVVLGSVAASRLGLADVSGDPIVWIGDRY